MTVQVYARSTVPLSTVQDVAGSNVPLNNTMLLTNERAEKDAELINQAEDIVTSKEAVEAHDQVNHEELKGRDMDEESTAQKFLNVVKQGDLSPRLIELVKSATKGKKKQSKETSIVPFIGILEPMQQSHKMERYKARIGLAQAVVNVSNKIWAFIDEIFEVSILYNMTQQLTLRLMHSETHVELILTLVYAKCDRTERIELWDTLYAMASDITVPWLVGGNFNVIRDEEEKYGGLPVSLIEVDDFRHCINTCNLTDLGFKGSIFTWWNGRSEEDCIFKILDRCFGNNELQQTFLGWEITHLSKIGSDHCPMLLKCDIETAPIRKSFRFLNFWTKHETFKDVVKENWNLKKLKQALSTWRGDTYGDIFQKIASLKEVVMVHERQFEVNHTQMNRQRLQQVQAEMIKYLALEEEFWRQKAGMLWFKDGDRNTKFFHAQVNGRRKRLKLSRIQNNLGNWIEEDHLIAEEAIKFYKDQFTESAVPNDFYILNHVPSMVDSDQHERLMALPSNEEVKNTVMGLNGDSTGGPDGLTGAFYQTCWDIIEENVVRWSRLSFAVSSCQGV
ncbi:uncharacterized protein [Nicotiana sylvestris]